MALPFTVVVVAALALAAVGCASPPADPTPPRQSASSEAKLGQVVGKAPATGSFPPIVILEPRIPRDFPAPTDPKVMDQTGYTFFPSLLLVQKGQKVEFRNSEDVLHNVRVTNTDTGTPVFNIATPPFGAYEHTFDEAGYYAVSCDVHPAMAANILVTSTPYAVVAEKDGRFTFSDVPPGSYTLTVYSGAQRIERVVEITGSRTELIVDKE